MVEGARPLIGATSLYALLERGRMRLNLILAAVNLATGLIWTGAAAAVIFILVNLAGWRCPPLYFWTALTAIAILAGLFMGRNKYLDLTAAARWLDQYLGDDEALSAALISLDRECAEPFDITVVGRAQAIAAQAQKIEWPGRFLLKRAALAIGILAITALLTAFVKPVAHGPAPNLMETDITTAGEKRDQKNPGQKPDMTPREIARYLFPWNESLALQAEQALLKGDQLALEQLLKQAERDLAKELTQAATVKEREQLQQQLETQRQLAQKMNQQGDGTGNTPASSGGQGKGGGNQISRTANSPGSGNQGTQNGKKNGQTGQGQGSSARQGGTDKGSSEYTARMQALHNGSPYVGQQGGQAPEGQGNSTKAGEGHSDKPGQFTSDTSASKGAQTYLVQRNRDGTLEFVMPGKDARVPLAAVLPGSQQAAEQALAKEGVPMEYEDFVRWYFQQLSQEK